MRKRFLMLLLALTAILSFGGQALAAPTVDGLIGDTPGEVNETEYDEKYLLYFDQDTDSNGDDKYVGSLYATQDGIGDWYFAFTYNPEVINDNSYGSPSCLTWKYKSGSLNDPCKPHTFKDLLMSDHSKYIVKDACGNTVLDFGIDLLAKNKNLGYGSGGHDGDPYNQQNDGFITIGDPSKILEYATSTQWNMWYSAFPDKGTMSPNIDEATYNATEEYVVIDIDPATNEPYEWEFLIVYEFKIDGSVFAGCSDPYLGDIVIHDVHNSPYKQESGVDITTKHRKLADPPSETEVYYGNSITYTIEYNFIGARIHNVAIIDGVDVNGTITGLDPCLDGLTSRDFMINGLPARADAYYNSADNTVVFDLGELGVGTDKPTRGSVSFTVDVNCNTAGEDIYNQGLVTSTITDPNVTKPTVHYVAAGGPPVLTITKSDSPDPVQAGEQLTYTLIIGNEGSSVANNVVVTEDYDANTTFISASPAPDAGTNNQWTFASLAAGGSKTITITVSVASPLDDGTILTNVAQAVSTETPTPVSDTEYTLVNSAPDLSTSSKAANPVSGSSVAPGATITYTVNYTNTGNMDATGVVISDVVDANLTNVVVLDGGTLVGSTITWSVGNVAAGASGSVSFTADVVSPSDNGTVINNTAAVDSDQTGPTNTNTTTHTVSSAPVLSIAKTVASTQTTKTVTNTGNITCSEGAVDSGSVASNEVSGTTLVYTLSYSNAGNMDATNVEITDQIPAGTVYVSNTGGGTYDSLTNTVTWNLGTVAVGTSGLVTMTVSLGDVQ